MDFKIFDCFGLPKEMHMEIFKHEHKLGMNDVLIDICDVYHLQAKNILPDIKSIQKRIVRILEIGTTSRRKPNTLELPYDANKRADIVYDLYVKCRVADHKITGSNIDGDNKNRLIQSMVLKTL